MSHGVALVLLSLALFQVKHFVADFVLQTAYLYRNKGIYGHPAGFIHAGIHAGGSVPAMLVLTWSTPLLLALLAVEIVVHYHTDWLKLYIDRRLRLGISQKMYWIVFGADQLIHQMTYLAFLAVMAAGL
jgi:hypothetical protein